MTLNEWLDRHGIKARWLAEQVGASEQTISRIRNGRQKPSLELQLAIERLTEGAVRGRDFMEPERCGDAG